MGTIRTAMSTAVSDTANAISMSRDGPQKVFSSSISVHQAAIWPLHSVRNAIKNITAHKTVNAIKNNVR